MEHFTTFFTSLGSLITPFNCFLLLFTVVVGIIFGALPGLSATLGIALLTTVTYSLNLPTEASMLALMGIYVGAIYGGSHPAILLNIPGTGAGAATAVEGYPLNLKGRAGETIATATIMSFIGTVFGVLAMLMFIPILSKTALMFQSSEYLLLALFGVLICGSLTSADSPVKGWIMGLLGMLAATIGMDPMHGHQRFTFGVPELIGGITPIPVILGGFAIPQIIQTIVQSSKKDASSKPSAISRVWPNFKYIYRKVTVGIRSGLIGVGVGSIPGVGEDIAAWLSYDVSKKASKEKEEYGKGSLEGVVAAETANNACIGGALIPLLTLGVPGSPPAMMLLGAIMLNGIVPGPRLPVENPGFIPQMSAILLMASFTMLICGFLMSRVSIYVLRIPVTLLMPVVALFAVIGSYSFDFSIFNVYLMIGFGIVAYFLRQMAYPIAPLVIGIILGPMAEVNLRRTLIDHSDNLAGIFMRPISLTLILLIIGSLFLQFRKKKA